MAISRIAIGTGSEVRHPDALRAVMAEFFSMIIFVFSGQGSAMAFNKLTDDGSNTPSGLIVAALAHAFGIMAAVCTSANISGGHLNPAITFGAFLGGQISLAKGLLYWIAQCLGSVVACLLLKFCTGGMTTTAFSLSSDITVWNAIVFEIVLTFGLVYTVYAIAFDPNRGNNGIIGPIVVAAIVGANILAGAAFDGASMNPALSFGPAVVSWTWANHWVYWLGPLLGSTVATIAYCTLFIRHDNNNYQQLPDN